MIKFLHEHIAPTVLARVRDAIRGGQRLPYGVHVALRESEVAEIAPLNDAYSEAVWGIDNDAANDRVRRDEACLIRNLVKKETWGRRVLDVGCGAGRLSLPLAKASGSLVAIDRSPGSVRRTLAALRGAGVSRKQASVSLVDLRDYAGAPFTCVALFENCIGMYPTKLERRGILDSARSRLTDGGIAIIGARVCAYVKSGDVAFQACVHRSPRFPDRWMCGITLNWSRRAFRDEVLSVFGASTTVFAVGTKRPSGGAMHYALASKA